MSTTVCTCQIEVWVQEYLLCIWASMLSGWVGFVNADCCVRGYSLRRSFAQ